MKYFLWLLIALFTNCIETSTTIQPPHEGVLCAINSDGSWYADTLCIEVVGSDGIDTVTIYPQHYGTYTTTSDSITITGYQFHRYDGYNYCLVVNKKVAIPIQVR